MFGRHDQDCESLKIIIMNYFIKPVTFLIFFLFFSCQNEDLTEESHSHLSKSEISFEQFKKETGLSTFETTIKINSHQLGFQYRNPDGSYELSDFILSTDLIKRVVVDERTTYTFQVHPVEESYTDRFFNLTMFYKEGWQSLLIELKPTDENLAQLRDGLTENFEGTMTRLYQSDLPLIGTQGCSTVFITYWHCTGTGQCAGGTCDQCELCVSSDSYTMCGSDPVQGNPVLYISAGPGGGGPGGGSSTTPVNEITIEPNINPSLQPDCNGSIDCINLENFRQFELGLTDEQRDILNFNESFRSSVFSYLSTSGFSDGSRNIVLQLIQLLIIHDGDFEFMETDNTNDFQVFDNFDNLNELFQAINTEIEDNSSGENGIVTQNQIVATRVIPLSALHDLAIEVVLNKVPTISIVQSSSTSYLSSTVVGNTWVQNSMTLTNLNATVDDVEITIIGYINIGVELDILKFGLKRRKKVTILVDKNTGKICCTRVENLD
jgi:hypothetical protein